jgi:hypothetical protein
MSQTLDVANILISSEFYRIFKSRECSVGHGIFVNS